MATQPFTIDKSEYQELIVELLELPSFELSIDIRFTPMNDFSSWFQSVLGRVIN